jgi:DNA-binding CsgD family transcriptional regulator
MEKISNEEFMDGFKNSLVFNQSIHERMLAVCKPLEQFGINYFYYIKIFNDGRKFYITNNFHFLKHVVENNLNLKPSPVMAQEIAQLSQMNSHCALWTGLPKDERHEILYQINIWNGISFYHKTKEYTEAFGFASNKENDNILNFYINKKSILDLFFVFFKEKNSDLINIQDENKFIQPISIFHNDIASPSALLDSNIIENFLKNITTEKFYLKNGISLGKREGECLTYFSTGKTAKEIARIMNLSPRTVESYIINVKRKVGINKKSELIDLFLDNMIHL